MTKLTIHIPPIPEPRFDDDSITAPIVRRAPYRIAVTEWDGTVHEWSIDEVDFIDD